MMEDDHSLEQQQSANGGGWEWGWDSNIILPDSQNIEGYILFLLTLHAILGSLWACYRLFYNNDCYVNDCKFLFF